MVYVMIEGPEGAGKTEGAAWLLSAIKLKGYDAMAVHEPGNGILGTLVRATLSGIKKSHYAKLSSYFRAGSETERLLERLTNSAYEDAELLKTIKADYATIREMVQENGAFDRLISALTEAREIDIEALQLLFTAVRSEDMKRLKPYLDRENFVVISDRGYPSTITYAESDGPNPEYAAYLKLVNSRFPRPDVLFILTADPKVLLQRVHTRGGTSERFDKLETLRNLAKSYARNFPDASFIDASQSREKVHEALLAGTMELLSKHKVRPLYKLKT